MVARILLIVNRYLTCNSNDELGLLLRGVASSNFRSSVPVPPFPLFELCHDVPNMRHSHSERRAEGDDE